MIFNEAKLIDRLESENAFLREQVKELQDKLMALADTRAYLSQAREDKTNSKDYYGGEGDIYVEHNQWGEPIWVEKPQDDK